MPMLLNMPARLITGPGCIEKNAALLTALGSRCLLVTGKTGAKRCGALDAVTAVLDANGIAHTLFDAVAPNPTVETCLAAGRAAREFGADFILGIGGGSALDAAKVAGIAAANPAMDETGLYSREWPAPGRPVVLVGTTAGTGSEVTSVSVLTDSRQRKHSIHDDRLYAALALGDASFTMSAPPAVTATTAIDVLAHCTESYFSRKADNLSRLYSVAGIRLFLTVAKETDGLKTALSYDQRERLYEASLLGGLAINPTGTVFAHTMGYVLTERFGIPHGFASAAFLPALLDGAAEALPDFTAGFYAAVGCSPEEFAAVYRNVMPALPVRMTEEEIDALLPRFEGNNSVNNTCYVLTQSRAKAIFMGLFCAD